MYDIPVTLTTNPKKKPEDESKLGFGKIFTDHMFIMDYEKGRGWHDARVVPYGPFVMDPACTVFHYAQEIFEGMKCYRRKDGGLNLFRPRDNFERMNRSAERMGMPKIDVEEALAGFDLTTLDAVCARGGMLPPCPSGAFAVDGDMIEYLAAITQGAHASNLGCVVARDIAEPLGIPSFVYDPVAVDEMPPMARITGIPELPRRMMGHALNTRAMAIRCAETVLHRPLDRCRLIVLHLGGGASVRLFIGGKMVDNVRDDELLFAPERCGGIAAEQLVGLCFSGKYDRAGVMKLVRGRGGLLAHLGTSDAMEVERRMARGDERAKLVYDAMLYTAAKSIGAMAAAAGGDIDRIILTGGIAHSAYVADYLTKKVRFIAPVEVMAGEFEMEALAVGAARVLSGRETAHRFRDLAKGE